MSKTQTATETAITIHAPHAGSDINMGNACAMLSCISIHAPHAGSDQYRVVSQLVPGRISIHAPHAGSDTVGRYRTPVQINFNPRSPRGERRDGDVLRVFGMPISIHAPHAGSDLVLLELVYGLRYISIHAPHAGSDLCRC